jgi:hypothetical protein
VERRRERGGREGKRGRVGEGERERDAYTHTDRAVFIRITQQFEPDTSKRADGKRTGDEEGLKNRYSLSLSFFLSVVDGSLSKPQ